MRPASRPKIGPPAANDPGRGLVRPARVTAGRDPPRTAGRPGDVVVRTLARAFAVLVAYVGVCFGLVARRHGRNPILWGLLSIVSPVNLALLGYWAATGRLPSRRG